MNKFLIFALTIVPIIAFSVIPDSEAKLWDFIVDVEFLENPISMGTNTTVFGTVFDHGYNPVANVDVKLTFAGQSHMLKTDELGEFGKQLDTDDLKPRTYAVHIFATTDVGKKSMANTLLQIDGHTAKSAKFERQLESMEMANDLSKLRKNSNDPVSVILYEHYLKLQDKVAHAQQQEELLNAPQQKIREIQQMTKEKLLDTLEDRPLIYRQFNDSTKLGKFLENLDDEKRTLFELQLNSTQIRFNESQIIMQELLKEGKSYDSARQAYLDYLSITQEEMNLILVNMEKTEISPQPSTNSTEN